MAKLKYTNKATGKTFTADAKDVQTLQANKMLKDAFTYEEEEAKPADLKTTTSK